MFGLPAHDMLGNGWLRGIHPDDIQKTAERWEKTIENWQPYRATYRVVNTHTRKEITVETTAEVITNNLGKALKIWGRVVQI